LLILLFAGPVVLLAAFVGSVAWVWRDADRRGQPGFIVAVLVAFLFWPLSLIAWLLARPAVQTGATAAAPPPSRSGRGCLWAALVMMVLVGIVVAAILLGVLLLRPASVKHRESADRDQCLMQVREIAVAYSVYQKKQGRSPVTLSDLHMNPACPDARRRSLPPPPKSNVSLVSYELLSGTNATDIIVREYWGNHRGKGGAIGFGDGHAEWCASPYRPLRTDVVRAGAEKKLRQMLGDAFVRVGTVSFDAPANRYDVEVHVKSDGQESVRVMELRQDGVGIANYAGTLDLGRGQGAPRYSLYVDELMEREPAVERELP
jgi:hypothetical protein